MWLLTALGLNLTDTWQWQDNTILRDLVPGLDSGAVGTDGNVFVVGSSSSTSGLSAYSSFSETSASSARFSVSKINGETGNDIRRFDNGTDGGVDRAFGVGVDAEGDVIVGGSTTGNWNLTGENSSYIGPQSFAAFKLNGTDCSTIWQYQSTNNQESSATSTSDGAEQTEGKIMSIAVNSEGDALFVGNNWNRSGEEIDLDGDSNYTIGKLNGKTGEEIWVKDGGLPGSFEALWACDVDSNDNIVAAGITGSSAPENGSDYLVVKYSTNGTELWNWTQGTQLNETLLAVVVDHNDDIYVAGGEGIRSIDSPMADASIVFKLAGSTGNEIWRYHGSRLGFSGGNILRGIAVDNSGDIVLAVGIGTDSMEYSDDSYSSADGYEFAGIVLNTDDGDDAGSWEGTPLQDDVFFALFDSEGSLFVGGRPLDDDDGSDFALTKFQEMMESPPATEPRPTQWLMISILSLGAVVVFIVLSIYIVCRVRRKIYLSKTVEDFGPVFRPGALPSTKATSRQGHSSQTRSNMSISSTIIKEIKIRNTEEISDKTEWTTNPFASTPDPPKGFAPKSPPEQETEQQRRLGANAVVTPPPVSPTVASVSFDVIAFPGYIVSPQLKEEGLQPSTCMAPQPYPSTTLGQSGKIDIDAQRKQSKPSTSHRRNDSAAASENDIENQAMQAMPDLSVLDSAARVSSYDAPKEGSKRAKGYYPPVEARDVICTSYLGEFFTSPVTTTPSTRQGKHTLKPSQGKHPSGRDASFSGVSRLVDQNGRTDSDSASIFGGASERAIARSPNIVPHEGKRSGTVVHIPYPLRRDRYGRTGMDGGNLSAASRMSYYKRSFTSVDSRQEEIRRENLHRVESWVTKATVFPKGVHKRFPS